MNRIKLIFYDRCYDVPPYNGCGEPTGRICFECRQYMRQISRETFLIRQPEIIRVLWECPNHHFEYAVYEASWNPILGRNTICNAWIHEYPI